MTQDKLSLDNFANLLRQKLHDINNQLFLICGKAELLMDEACPPEMKEELKGIIKAGDKAKEISAECSRIIKDFQTIK